MTQKNTKIKSKKDRNFGTILGIKVLSTHRKELLTSLEDKISYSNNNPRLKLKYRIVTPNPELVLMSLSNNKLAEALNTADYSIPDGIGLSQANFFNSLTLPKNIYLRYVCGFFAGFYVGVRSLIDSSFVLSKLEVIKGRELFLDLVGLAHKNKWKIFLLGGEDTEAEFTATVLKNKFKNINIKFARGPILNKYAQPVSKVDTKIYIDIVKTINSFKPQLLFIAFKNPKQEIWAKENIGKLNTNLIMTVGGTFRYISGMKSLPPRWMENMGLEWIWRFITDPSRFKRILNAFPIFPWTVYINKVKSSTP